MRALAAITLLIALTGTPLCQELTAVTDPNPIVRGLARGMLMSSPIVTPVSGEEIHLFLRGLDDGDHVLDTEISLWDLSDQLLGNYLHCLATHGLNALPFDPPPDWTGEQVLARLDVYADYGVHALMDTPVMHRAVLNSPPTSPTPRPGELWVGPPLAPETLCEASLRGTLGVLLGPPAYPGDDLEEITAFALWADAVPWGLLEPDRIAMENPPEGITGWVRADRGGRCLLLWVSPAVADSPPVQIDLAEVAPGPHLLDVFSMVTMRRRRSAVMGPAITLTLSPREMRGDCLILVAPLPPDWAMPNHD